MPAVTSRDGTRIAFSRVGQGPAIVLIDGALCHRGFGPMRQLAAALSTRYSVITFDRRGRGESGDSQPYSIEREIEDIAAVAKATGDQACAFGVSSGAALAVEAANAGVPFRKVATYEAPFIVDSGRSPIPADFLDNLRATVAAGRNGEAVKQFMRLVQAPRFMIALMPLMPMWSKLKAVAPTLCYDISFMEEFQQGRPLPRERWSHVTVPSLVIDGGKSPAWLRTGNRALADSLPSSTYRTLPGQTHMVKIPVLAPVLADFFAS